MAALLAAGEFVGQVVRSCAVDEAALSNGFSGDNEFANSRCFVGVETHAGDVSAAAHQFVMKAVEFTVRRIATCKFDERRKGNGFFLFTGERMELLGEVAGGIRVVRHRNSENIGMRGVGRSLECRWR